MFDIDKMKTATFSIYSTKQFARDHHSDSTTVTQKAISDKTLTRWIFA